MVFSVISVPSVVFFGCGFAALCPRGFVPPEILCRSAFAFSV